jgi:hypothetical protein
MKEQFGPADLSYEPASFKPLFIPILDDGFRRIPITYTEDTVKQSLRWFVVITLFALAFLWRQAKSNAGKWRSR